METKTHKQLQIPLDSAWGRKTIWKYLPIWVKQIFQGLRNIFLWIPIIYKDRNWDGHYVFEIIKFKLLQQRKYLVEANRHEGVPILNRDITLCLNLIERIQEEYYNMEYMDYCKDDFNWIKSEEHIDCHKLDIVPVWEKFDEYFAKHKASVKKVLKQDRNLSSSKKKLAMMLSIYNQEKCQKLLFKLLNEKINHWWD